MSGGGGGGRELADDKMKPNDAAITVFLQLTMTVSLVHTSGKGLFYYGIDRGVAVFINFIKFFMQSYLSNIASIMEGEIVTAFQNLNFSYSVSLIKKQILILQFS